MITPFTTAKNAVFSMSADANLVIFFRIRKKIQALFAGRGVLFYVPLYFSCRSFALHIIILQTKELVMNQANVKESFYMKKSEAEADGNCTVMAKLNVGK